jgi:predicted DNA-binding transcriptional regulator AlpA
MAGTTPRGRFGSPVGWIEAEIDYYIVNQIRAARRLPPLPPPLPPEPGDHPKIIRVKEVERRTGMGRVVIWKLEKRGVFPRRVKLAGFGEESADAASR